MALIGTLSELTLALASVAAWNGLWPILVIAVLQVVLLGLIFVRAWKSAWTVETISVNSESIAVLQEHYSRSSRLELKPAWTKVVLRQPVIRWYPPSLWLKCGGTRVELGAYLNTTEKRQFAAALQKAIEPYCAWQHPQIETEVSQN
jgi:uncharacterized membrane protein